MSAAQVAAAYETLSDAKKRQVYDQVGGHKHACMPDAVTAHVFHWKTSTRGCVHA